jgi:hypothetical protein
MAKVKVYTEGDETHFDVDRDLYKALDHHASGDVHMRESFDDPAMVALSRKLDNLHEQIYKDMLEEIQAVLDEEYEGGNQ